MATHVDLQGAGAGAAFVAALGKGRPAAGVGLLGLLIRGGHGRGAGTLAAGTVVEEVGLQVPPLRYQMPQSLQGKTSSLRGREGRGESGPA